jgi:hypothetical protein
LALHERPSFASSSFDKRSLPGHTVFDTIPIFRTVKAEILQFNREARRHAVARLTKFGQVMGTVQLPVSQQPPKENTLIVKIRAPPQAFNNLHTEAACTVFGTKC